LIYVDRTLSEKLERVEGRANADFVETRGRLQPGSGARWVEVGGTYAMFDGAESPCTQTFGLGLFEDSSVEHLIEIECFFADNNAPVFHEVSPMADPRLIPLLNDRGYHPIELSSVMYQELDSSDVAAADADPKIRSRVIRSDEVDLWAKTSADGWATEHPGLADFMFDFGRISAQCSGAHPYLAEIDGKPIATGMMFVHDSVALLAGASTIPEGRNKGAQNALFRGRLGHAAELGCKMALMAAAPGSQSQRNAQKNGFSIAYTRTKWHLAQAD
jgi:hypothetical protein